MANAEDLDPVALMLKAVLVGDDGEHPFELLVGEFEDLAATYAQQMPVPGLSSGRLKALEAFTKIMRLDQPALQQHVERPIDGRNANPLSPFFEAALNPLDGKMILGAEDGFRHEVPLPGDRLMMIPQIPAETLEESDALIPAEACHDLLAGTSRRATRASEAPHRPASPHP